MCAAVAGVALTGQSDVATSNESERGFRGAALGLPGAVLSSASPIVLGEPVEPGKLQAGGGRLIEGSLASEAASLEQAKAALKDVQTHHHSGVELTARLGQTCKDFAAQIYPSLDEVTKVVSSCSEMRSKLSGEMREQFESALSAAARGGPLSSALSNAQNTFEQLYTHADLYIDALRNCIEPRLSGLAIDNDSRAMIDSALTGLTTALKGAGLKTENASNQKRMAELSQQLHATIDDANGLIDANAVQAVKESFSKYFEVAGTRLKGWDVFCEHLDRLASAAESTNSEYATAAAALLSIGGTVREKPAYPIENVGAGGTVSISALSSEILAEMGIDTPDTTPPDVVEMNRLLRKAAHAAQGLPPPPADFVEDDRVEKLEKSSPTHLATRGDVQITTIEYRRGEELVGRDIVLSNTKLNTAITLRADFDQFWNLDEKETGMRRDASSREYGRSEAAMAFTKFEAALGKLPNASR
ncbi:MAG: hypothetical protein J0M12_18055, partial [Deltaproteobacteria bacterium]|nr:hypothetical protein [Deltaproteobacteria bacterium]